VKIVAAALALISLTGALVLPCVCVADEVAGGHGCCAPRTSMQAADSCCPPPVARPVAPALSTVSDLPSAMPAFRADDRTFALPSTPLPRRIACARTPILRI